jgi:hypothetical protein
MPQKIISRWKLEKQNKKGWYLLMSAISNGKTELENY